VNFQQLITFSTVVSEGSMTAAAEKLYLTQPAVSQQIRNLEEELGVNILDRGSRQAKLTTQGQMLYDYAKRIISLTQQAQAAVQTMGSVISGKIRVGTVNSIGLQFVSPVLGQFLKHNSKISVSLRYDDADVLWQALTLGHLDVAILPEIDFPQNSPDIEGRPLMKDEMLLVASGRDATANQVISAQDLSGKPFVLMTERYRNFQQQFEQVMKESGVKLTTVFESNNVGTLKRVVETGLGWGFLPAHSVRKQVRTGRMSVIETEGALRELRSPFNVMFYWRPKSELAGAGELLFRALKQQGLQG
jgi:LysR family transcriptional regulator, transcriptional activator of the cysJI operon